MSAKTDPRADQPEVRQAPDGPEGLSGVLSLTQRVQVAYSGVYMLADMLGYAAALASDPMLLIVRAAAVSAGNRNALRGRFIGLYLRQLADELDPSPAHIERHSERVA